MMTIQLSGNRVILNPPQRLLMLDIREESETDGVTIVHGSARERELTLVSRTEGPPPENFLMPSAIAARDLSHVPLISQLDVRDLPPPYRLASGALQNEDHFLQGRRYCVLLVSESIIETTVVAE